ncbi:predicted protein [Nematostella vectensis]|uniref:Apple domain-containing protein n=1 Tax=Nematostella vectensis TaxID=45351 RepID=A7RU08_NEMVE|nr:predicted protein [Nematostella vectensis]|eukprot:XP_001637184.1 predicted protein [Nematostella vectensis]
MDIFFYAFISLIIPIIKNVMSQVCPLQNGICYGGTFEANKRKKGQYLVGASYKNLSTVRHIQGCFSACVNECLCRAYQMSSTGCELLEEDKNSRTLEPNSDYIYFELNQNIIRSTSYMANPSICKNGCCLSSPCLNGGTCTEQCEHPKTKFVCVCPSYAIGKRCEHFMPKSCLDFYKAPNARIKPTRGVYTIFKNDNSTLFKVYCDFTQPNKAWTLIESFATKHIQEFRPKSFMEDYPLNQETPGNHKKYRLARQDMQMIKATAMSYRATCKFLTRANVTDRDYMEGRLSAWDIIEEASDDPYPEYCRRLTYVNVEGYSCSDCTMALFQKKGTWHAHGEMRHGCDFQPPGYNNTAWQVFGWYQPIRSSFLCTDSEDSTTEYWLGHEMK